MFKEYKELNFRFDIGLITMFIVIKSYIMLLLVLIYIVLKEQLDQYYSLIDILLRISQLELIAITLGIFLPVIYNLIVWIKKKHNKGLKDGEK